jgi:hypothetical protein
MPRDTGFPARDASDDFLRARRRQTAKRLARAFGDGDVQAVLPFEEVVAELGRTAERDLGLQVVQLDTIVGSVGRAGDFDRAFLPTTSQVRSRWERIATAMRRGEPLPPVDLFRVGEVHFVRDGHHRVSVARALGREDIDARVVEVQTRVGAERGLRVADLPLKGHERLFRERVPLPPDRAARVVLSDPERYGDLAEGVEGWGFRAMQDRGELMDRATTAQRWFEEEFVPVTEALREAGLVGKGETEADAFERLGGERYRLWRTMDWSDEVIERLQKQRRRRRQA